MLNPTSKGFTRAAGSAGLVFLAGFLESAFLSVPLVVTARAEEPEAVVTSGAATGAFLGRPREGRATGSASASRDGEGDAAATGAVFFGRPRVFLSTGSGDADGSGDGKGSGSAAGVLRLRVPFGGIIAVLAI